MDNDKKNKANNEDFNVDQLLAERDRLDKLFKDKFKRIITVMFTDLKGSTAIAEMQGDLMHRNIIKHQNDIIFPTIEKYKGILVKTMGDGTMSYFEKAQDCLRAAAEIQKGIDDFNLTKTINIPILLRAGIHTGEGIVEDNDIFGDVVNVAARFEGQAMAGEICISEETFNALDDKSEIYCRFIKEVEVKGKKEPVKLFKAFWNPKEVEADILQAASAPKIEGKKGLSRNLILAISMIIVVLIALIIYFGDFSSSVSVESRSKEHSVVIPESKENPDDLKKLK
jgi:class 3 adenylate cyclase